MRSFGLAVRGHAVPEKLSCTGRRGARTAPTTCPACRAGGWRVAVKRDPACAVPSLRGDSPSPLLSRKAGVPPRWARGHAETRPCLPRPGRKLSKLPSDEVGSKMGERGPGADEPVKPHRDAQRPRALPLARLRDLHPPQEDPAGRFRRPGDIGRRASGPLTHRTAAFYGDSRSSDQGLARGFLPTPPRGGSSFRSDRSSRHHGLKRTFTSGPLPGRLSPSGSRRTN